MFLFLAFAFSAFAEPLSVKDAAEVGRRSLRVISDMMSHADPEVRAKAAACWGPIGNKSAKRMLRGALKDAHPVVRIEAAFSLNLLGDDKGYEILEAIVLATTTASSRVKVSTKTAPIDAAGDAAREIVRNKIRALAVERLGEMGGVKAVEILERSVEDPSDMVRDASAVSLARLGFDELDAVFVETLKDPRESVRAATARALGLIGRPIGINELRSAAGDASPAVRAEVLRTLGMFSDFGNFELFYKGLSDGDRLVQAAAVESMGKLRMDASKKVLNSLAVSTQSAVMALKAQSSLSRRGEKVNLSLAERALRLRDADLLIDAMALLQVSREEDATTMLQGVLDSDHDPKVRLSAAAALVSRLQKPPRP